VATPPAGGRRAIGFPVFVKAAAGGGGRGLRRIDDPDDLEVAVETAIREAEAPSATAPCSSSRR
jgi:pyruvate carboxylase